MVESLLTKADVMELFNISASTCFNWQQRKYLLPVSIGSKIYYKAADINELINKSYEGI